MMVRKLRLERGWSQEQLAQMSGLNPRTIQRIESGHTPGLESLKSLAAVFEIDISQLSSQLSSQPYFETSSETQQEQHMGDTSITNNTTATGNKDLRIQLIGLFAGYLLTVAMLWVSNLMTYPQYLWAIFPTVSLAFPVLYIAITGALTNNTGKPTLLESLYASLANRIKSDDKNN